MARKGMCSSRNSKDRVELLRELVAELMSRHFRDEITAWGTRACFLEFLEANLGLLEDIVEDAKKGVRLSNADAIVQEVNSVRDSTKLLVEQWLSTKETDFMRLQKTIIDLGGAIKREYEACIRLNREALALLKAFNNGAVPAKAKWVLGRLIIKISDSVDLNAFKLGILSGFLVRLKRFIAVFRIRFLNLFDSVEFFRGHRPDISKGGFRAELRSLYHRIGRDILTGPLSEQANEAMIRFLDSILMGLSEFQSIPQTILVEPRPDIDFVLEDIGGAVKKVVSFSPCRRIDDSKEKAQCLLKDFRAVVDQGRDLLTASAVAHAYRSSEDPDDRQVFLSLIDEFDQSVPKRTFGNIFAHARTDLFDYAKQGRDHNVITQW